MEQENTIQIEGFPESSPPEQSAHKQSGHHHSSRHHHSHTHKKKRTTSIKRRKAWGIIGIPVGILLILLLFLAGLRWVRTLEYTLNPHRNTTASTSTSSPDTTAAEDHVSLNISVFLEPQPLTAAWINTYLSASADTSINQIIAQQFESTDFVRQDRPETVTMNFGLSGLPESCVVRQVQVELSESLDFSQATSWEPVHKSSATFYNLKTGTTYYYQVRFTLSTRITRTCSGFFTTAEGPRLLSIDGIANVRDIGGWKTADGQTIHQGLLYRGSELDGVTDPAYTLTADGIDEMLNTLGICYDLDLRANTGEATGTYILGSDAIHQNFPLEAFGSDSAAVIGDIFRQLAEPANYPMYLHCTDGTANTGAVCLILEALLGVSQEDLVRDYELSALYSGSVSLEPMEQVLSLLQTYDGESLQQQAENYLLSCGVTQTELDSIRSIFLG